MEQVEVLEWELSERLEAALVDAKPGSGASRSRVNVPYPTLLGRMTKQTKALGQKLSEQIEAVLADTGGY